MSNYTDFIKTGDAVLGDTEGRKYRISMLEIRNGTAAASLKITMLNCWNGDAIAVTDNIVKNATTGNYELDSTGKLLYVKFAGLSGNVLHSRADIIYNSTGTQYAVYAPKLADKIRIMLYNPAYYVTTYDWTAQVDGLTALNIELRYFTDA